MKGPSVKQSKKCKACPKLADLPTQVDLPLDLNGNFRFEIFKLILADQLADLPPASGSEWQFQIFTVRAHMGRSIGRSTLPPGNGN